MLDDERNKMSRRGRFALAEVWQFFCAIFLVSDAEYLHRTKQALRIARRADQRAEFHQRLVKCGARTFNCRSRREEALTGSGFRMRRLTSAATRGIETRCVRHQFFRQIPQPRVRFLFLWIFSNAKNSGENPDDVAIQNRRGLIEGDAANRARRITADSGQCQNVVKLIRKFVGDDVRSLYFFSSLRLVTSSPTRCLLRHDLLRGLLQIADARVVAEAFPQLVDFFRRRFRGGFNRRQFAQPAVPKGDNRFHLRLLQHDFGNPDRVRIARAPPRQVAGVRGEPVQQRGDEF